MLVFIDDSACITPLNLSNSPISLDITFRLSMLGDLTLISMLVGDSLVAETKITEKDKMTAMDMKFFNIYKL